jgi:hypothetical protein
VQDRPTLDELLAAVERWLREDVVSNQTGALRYQGRVAANILRAVRREVEHDEDSLEEEWRGLDALLGAAERPASFSGLRDTIRARTEDLCARIQDGHADKEPFRTATLVHVRNAVRQKLLVTNPDWLNGAS